MQCYKFEFSDYEKKKNDELEDIMKDWILQVSTKNKGTLNNGNETKLSPESCFAKDGFFPGYFSQKRKILFIGREPRKISGKDFRDTTKEHFDEYFNNNNPWWRRILYIVYGIKTEGKCAFENVRRKKPSGILKEMDEKNDFGFACINISKYSNDHPTNSNTNKSLVNQFLKDSELEVTNFFQKEINLLEPDIIITANLWDGTINEYYMNLCLPKDNFSKGKSITHNKECVATYYKYNQNGRKVDCIDLFHFSARKRDKFCYYDPVMKFLFPRNTN